MAKMKDAAFMSNVKSRVQLLKTNLAAGLTHMSDEHRLLSATTSDGIIELASQVESLTVDTAILICEDLNDKIFCPDDGQRLRTVITGKTDMRATLHDEAKPNQIHMHMYNY